MSHWFDRQIVARFGRYSLLILALLTFLAVSFATRMVLAVANLDQVSGDWLALVPALAVGLLYDLLVGLWLLIPLGLFLLIVSDRWLAGKFWRWVVVSCFSLALYGWLYLGVVEYFFLGEFSARFNSVAVDYLIFPHEVFVNLWDTYPVWQALLAVLIATALTVWWLLPKLSATLQINTLRAKRLKWFGLQVALILVGTIVLSPRLAQLSGNRVVNEIAMNGLYSFTDAALTSELDYNTYYARLDDRAAFQHAREQLTEPDAIFHKSSDSLSIDRLITCTAKSRPLNVVIVLEESFGSRFVKSLDPNGPGSAVEFELLADSGILFTNIYATGNRTVRGLEAVLASFPPIPGQSVVRRPGGEHIFTLPSLLKSFDYQTAFIYGGYSYFDNMGRFASTNGFDRVIDRTNLHKKSFTTIWGVCDEDLFDNSLAILDTMQATGRPFFALLLTVSNHSPYTFPDGRVNTDPNDHTRENAVRYADYSLAKFLHEAESHAYFDSTIFVVLGDHGARVYGSQQIPMDSYRIPVLFYAPRILPHGERLATLGSQIDVSPTIMGILRESYASEFFGHDLLSGQVEERAYMSHNRDVTLLRDNRMAVLGIQSAVELFDCDSVSGAFTPLSPDADTALVNDAIGTYQSAYYLYQHQLLHPLPQTVAERLHAGK